MSARIRVFCAISLDGFIAGPGNDLSWLPPPPEDGSDHGFGALLAEVGLILMGRATYDVVDGFGDLWPYGQIPVWVATHRSLEPKRPTVQGASGPMDALLDRALAGAGGKDVYLDGGQLVCQALNANRVDLLTLTIVPVALGAGHPLFAGLLGPHAFTLVESRALSGGLVQIDLVPAARPEIPGAEADASEP